MQLYPFHMWNITEKRSADVMTILPCTRCKSSLLWRNFYNAILASDSEPDMFVSGEAGHEQKMLARYRSPRKDRQIVGREWIQTLIALNKIGYFYTLPSRVSCPIGTHLSQLGRTCESSCNLFLASDSEPALYIDNAGWLLIMAT